MWTLPKSESAELTQWALYINHYSEGVTSWHPASGLDSDSPLFVAYNGLTWAGPV